MNSIINFKLSDENRNLILSINPKIHSLSAILFTTNDFLENYHVIISGDIKTKLFIDLKLKQNKKIDPSIVNIFNNKLIEYSAFIEKTIKNQPGIETLIVKNSAIHKHLQTTEKNVKITQKIPIKFPNKLHTYQHQIFCNRTKELNILKKLTNLSNKSPKHIIIVGEKDFGKTTLILKFSNYVNKTNKDIQVVYLNNKQFSENNLHKKLLNIINDFDKLKRIIIIIDEFHIEYLLQKYIKKYLNYSKKHKSLFFIFSGRYEQKIMITHLKKTCENIKCFDFIEIKPLTKPQTYTLLKKIIKFFPKKIETTLNLNLDNYKLNKLTNILYKYSNGIPVLIRKLLEKYLEQTISKTKPINLDSFFIFCENELHTNKGIFDYYFRNTLKIYPQQTQNFSDPLNNILIEIIKKKEISKKDLIKNLNINPKLITEKLEQLENNFIKKKKNNYVVSFNIIHRWFMENEK